MPMPSKSEAMTCRYLENALAMFPDNMDFSALTTLVLTPAAQVFPCFPHQAASPSQELEMKTPL